MMQRNVRELSESADALVLGWRIFILSLLFVINVKLRYVAGMVGRNVLPR